MHDVVHALWPNITVRRHSRTVKCLLIACIVIAVIAVSVLAFLVLDDLVGLEPRGLTVTRICLIKGRIFQYARSHNQLPHSLSDLPLTPGYDNSICDGWGRAIAYEVSPSGLVTLTSRGRDGKVGGSDKDADMVATFPTRDAQGRWSYTTIQWNHDPFSQ